MKKVTRLFVLGIIVLSALYSSQCFSEKEAAGDRTLSPYFFVKSDDAWKLAYSGRQETIVRVTLIFGA